MTFLWSFERAQARKEEDANQGGRRFGVAIANPSCRGIRTSDRGFFIADRGALYVVCDSYYVFRE